MDRQSATQVEKGRAGPAGGEKPIGRFADFFLRFTKNGWKSGNARVRARCVARTRKQEDLLAIVKGCLYAETRAAALAKVADQAALGAIAGAAETGEEVARQVFGAITDQTVLFGFAAGGGVFAAEAVGKIKSPAMLRALLMRDVTAEVFGAVVAKLPPLDATDCVALLRVADKTRELNDSIWMMFTRYGAPAQRDVAELAHHAANRDIRLRAVQCLKSEDECVKVLENEREEEIVMVALRKVRSRGPLLRLVAGAKSENVAIVAWNSLPTRSDLTQEELKDVARGCANAEIRAIAVSCVTDRGFLVECAGGNDAGVVRAAWGKLKADGTPGQEELGTVYAVCADREIRVEIISMAEENLGRDSAGYREDFVDMLYMLSEIY